MKIRTSRKLPRKPEPLPKSGAAVVRGRPFKKGNQLGRRTQFRAGVSPNPGGRTKWAVVSEYLRKQLAMPLPMAEHKTIASALGDILIDQGLAGSLEAIREILDRVEGKPRQAIEFAKGDPLTELLQECRQMSTTIGPPENTDGEVLN
ncbi:MAG TPA: DUF5681 domain-containing protein [Candidatus Acidoferrales bacterium]|nr:DUF5681 domain-containing protein [Candidatus Acidoferrales bacterium]